ncbi:triacylglycerol lipase [Trichoderma barbatum]
MTTERPRILAISLHLKPSFDEGYSSLLTELRAKADFQRVKSATLAMELLSQQSQPRFSAILLTDEALSLEENTRVWVAVLGYIHGGGTAIAMGHFPRYVQPENIAPFFSKARLGWGAGSRRQTTLLPNENVIGKNVVRDLPLVYTQRALFVSGVATENMWYQTNQYSLALSTGFAPISAHVPGETAVALAEFGRGRLGYVGDIDGEEVFVAVILAMCGLL